MKEEIIRSHYLTKSISRHRAVTLKTNFHRHLSNRVKLSKRMSQIPNPPICIGLHTLDYLTYEILESHLTHAILIIFFGILFEIFIKDKKKIEIKLRIEPGRSTIPLT